MALLFTAPPIDVFDADRQQFPAIYREAPPSAQSSGYRLDDRHRSELRKWTEVSQYLRVEQNYRARYAELDSLGTLQRGWDTYSAEPPNLEAVALGRSALAALRRRYSEPAGVRTSGEGGVAICFSVGVRRAQLEFLNTGEAYALTYGLNDKADSWEVGTSEAGIAGAWERIHAFLQS